MFNLYKNEKIIFFISILIVSIIIGGLILSNKIPSPNTNNQTPSIPVPKPFPPLGPNAPNPSILPDITVVLSDPTIIYDIDKSRVPAGLAFNINYNLAPPWFYAIISDWTLVVNITYIYDSGPEQTTTINISNVTNNYYFDFNPTFPTVIGERQLPSSVEINGYLTYETIKMYFGKTSPVSNTLYVNIPTINQ